MSDLILWFTVFGAEIFMRSLIFAGREGGIFKFRSQFVNAIWAKCEVPRVLQGSVLALLWFLIYSAVPANIHLTYSIFAQYNQPQKLINRKSKVGVGVMRKFCQEVQLHRNVHHAVVYVLSQLSVHSHSCSVLSGLFSQVKRKWSFTLQSWTRRYPIIVESAGSVPKSVAAMRKWVSKRIR